MQKDGIDDAEHNNIHPDSEHQRNHLDSGERGRPAQRTLAVANVEHQVFLSGQPFLRVILLPNRLDPTELQPRLAAAFGWRQRSPDVLFCL